MDNLLKQYRWFGLLCLQAAITLQFFMVRHVDDWAIRYFASNSFAAKLLMFIASSSVLFFLIGKLPLLWYEHVGWKLFNPKINIEGRWQYSVVYYNPDTSLLRKEGQDKLLKILSHIKDNHGQMWVDQGVFLVSVQEGVGYLGQGPTAFKVTWKGSAVIISTQGTVGLYYSTNHGGVKFNGFDDLVVRSRDARGRPTELFGHFWMVSEGTAFVLRGEITYTRDAMVAYSSAPSTRYIGKTDKGLAMAEQSHALEPAAGPDLNGTSSPPAQ
jgi:hypothetical protein